MSLERAPLEHEPDADPNWFAPIAMFIAWLAHLFEQITKLKRIRRTTRFKPNWRDHWKDLRQCEWMRDQILAAGAAQLLAGKDLDLNAFIPSTELPELYGGSCPKTPFEMNRRFLAFARWHENPEPGIRAHARRIAQREGIDISGCPLRLATRATSPALHAEEESHLACNAHRSLSSLAARRGRWRALARVGGGSRSCRGPPNQRAANESPPRCPTSENAPACPQRRTGISTRTMTTRANLMRLMKQAYQLAPARRS